MNRNQLLDRYARAFAEIEAEQIAAGPDGITDAFLHTVRPYGTEEGRVHLVKCMYGHVFDNDEEKIRQFLRDRIPKLKD